MKSIWITNGMIIKLLNFLANSTLIDSVVVGKKIVFNLNGYLIDCEDGECGCILGDLAPCGEIPNSCIFGYKIKADSNSDFDWFVVPERTKREVRSDD